MILDNHNKHKRVHEWIANYTKEGSIDAVTGYFTIGALAYLSDKVNDRVDKFRIIIGDIVSDEVQQERPLDLLNENLTIEAAIKLKSTAQAAVTFLEQNKVLVKTMEPNFCHAKAWVYHEPETPNCYYILGSSNLTEAGLGLKATNNIELNTVGQGTDANYMELKEWFSELWSRPETKNRKTVDNKKVDFKQYLIDEIKNVFIEYTPKDIYYKTLFEMFGRSLLDFQDSPDIARGLGRLEDSAVFNKLYEFQKKGVYSLIKMIETYDGAILADAVGLGKTWSALAVMKYYQSQGRDVILLCPKKLEQNWRKFLKNHDSCFEKDQFEYLIRFHTDLQDERLANYDDGLGFDYLQRDKPKLLVIDESHNLRNSKSNRYKFLVDNILRANHNIKVLQLSATPINNSLIDIRNQFKLIVKDNSDGFSETLGVNNIDSLFRKANNAFKSWGQGTNRTISTFIHELPPAFFRMTDALVVARTRSLISGFTDELKFPEKAKPQNLFMKGKLLGEYESFEDFIDGFPEYFSAYRPACYIEQVKGVGVLDDEQQRDMFLTKMMQILLLKRLESSWYSFASTLRRLLAYHENALAKVKKYLNDGHSVNLSDDDLFEIAGEEIADIGMTLGKREITIKEIADAGKIKLFEKHLNADLKNLKSIDASLMVFENNINGEVNNPYFKNKSHDEKLTELIRLIKDKRASGNNRGNEKVLIFTAFADTADYLFDQLQGRGFKRLAVVTGKSSRTDKNPTRPQKAFEPILQRFAPYTKLFNEKEWPAFNLSSQADTSHEQYEEWKEWVRDNSPKTAAALNHPIDILIATDCLSEGQNLQDCDYVINYDIHWNPVRAIQRMGRIDRLGSLNDKVFATNFWPTQEINTYLSLQKRIEDRMVQMRLTGTEINREFTETLKAMLDDEHIEQTQEAKLIEQMQNTWDDLETTDQNLSFEHFSLEGFRQELMAELSQDKEKYIKMPNGIYSGFIGKDDICPESGLIALLGYPARKAGERNRAYKNYELIYLDEKGMEISINQTEVLSRLAHHKNSERQVPSAVNTGCPEALAVYSSALKSWLKRKAQLTGSGDENSSQVKLNESLLNAVMAVRNNEIKVKAHERAFEKQHHENNYDLILWSVVSLNKGG